MRSPALLLVLLAPLAGCLDAEGVQITMRATLKKGDVAVESRMVGLHRGAVEECGSADACRDALRAAACSAAQDTDAPDATGVVTVVEPQDDGSLDLVTTYHEPLAALARFDDDDGFRGAARVKPGGRRKELPTAAWTIDEDVVVDVLAGRFDSFRTGPEAGDGTALWVQRSNRGAIRFSVKPETPGADAQVRWAGTVPGPVEGLRTAPVACTAAEAGPAPE